MQSDEVAPIPPEFIERFKDTASIAKTLNDLACHWNSLGGVQVRATHSTRPSNGQWRCQHRIGRPINDHQFVIVSGSAVRLSRKEAVEAAAQAIKCNLGVDQPPEVTLIRRSTSPVTKYEDSSGDDDDAEKTKIGSVLSSNDETTPTEELLALLRQRNIESAKIIAQMRQQLDFQQRIIDELRHRLQQTSQRMTPIECVEMTAASHHYFSPSVNPYQPPPGLVDICTNRSWSPFPCFDQKGANTRMIAPIDGHNPL